MFLYYACFCPYKDGFNEAGTLWSEATTFIVFALAALFLYIPAASALGESLGTVGVWVIYMSIAGNVVLSVVQTIKTWKELVWRFRRIMEKVRENMQIKDTTGRSIQPI